MASTLNEHYRYLKLGERTEAYRAALAEVVEDGDVVADLGCGFGILGLLALQAGAARCHGIDSTAAIEIARETMQREGLGDRFNAIRASTFDTDLPEPVDLAVCDHIGFFGIDYGIIALLEDAKRFLKPGGTIMPRSMAVQVALVDCPKAYDRVVRWQGDAIPEAFAWLSEREVNTMHSRRFAATDLLSDSHTVAHVDFTRAVPDTFRFRAEIQVRQSGTVHGLAGWFDCSLTQAVRVTSNPQAKDAMGRENAFFAAREPFAVNAGETIEVAMTIRHDQGIFNWELTPPGTGAKQSMSTWNAMTLSKKGRD